MTSSSAELPDWGKIKPLLETCVRLSAEEREPYLREHCGADTAEYVLQLLAAEAQADADEFLVSPASDDLAGPRAGTRVGAWRLVERIGEGGMGVVWRGKRADGAFAKRVAVKLLKVGMRQSALQQRFQTEIQVLASLEHASIARFYDGGRTDEGVPFLVLEYVDGDPVDRWCDQRELGLHERIELFLQICDGVQYAHEHGVLHRDLKPANVLVGADGTPRLLDFGIARVVGEIDGVETLEMTRTGQRLYSPRYASPEQVRGDDTSATSDVYSLGVMLYELLTGRPPYTLTRISQFELERAALETDAARPSHAVLRPPPETDGENVDGPSAWSVRGLQDTREHQRRLSGDLDWILLAALRKDPSRRYATVRDFAEDLRRHLSRLPVRARPESRKYWAKRFVQRNRLLVASSMAVVAALITGLVLALASSARANRASEQNERTAYRSALNAAAAGLDSGSVQMAVGALQDQPEDLRGWEWRHLFSRSDRSAAFYPEAPSQTEGSGIALSPGGTWAAVGSLQSVLWIDLESGATVASDPFLAGFELTSLSAAPDGSELLAGMRSGHLLTYDPLSRELTRSDKLSEESLYGVAHSPAGDVLACADYSGTVYLLERTTRAEINRWQAHERGELLLHFSPDGARLATTSWDGTAKIWDARTRELIASCEGHERWVTDAAWTSSGDRLATSSTDGTVAIWDPGTGALLQSHSVHQGLVTSVKWMPGDEEVVSTGFGGEVLVCNAKTGERVARLLGHRAEVASVELDATRGRLITAGQDGMRLWLTSTADIRTGDACEYSVILSVSPDGERVLCAGPDGILRFFTPLGHELEQRTLDLPSGTQRGLPFTADWVEDRVATLNLEPDGYALRHPQLPGGVVRVRPAGDEDHGLGLAWASATDQVVALASGNNALIDLSEGARIPLQLDEQPLVLHACAVSPDGRLLATGGYSGLHLWQLPSGAHTVGIPRSDQSVSPRGLAFSPDSSRLFVATSAGLSVLDPVEGSNPRLIPEMTQAASVAHHPFESRLAIGHEDGRVTIVDSSRLEVLTTLGRHAGVVRNLVFTPDGKTLITLGAEGTIKFWTTD